MKLERVKVVYVGTGKRVFTELDDRGVAYTYMIKIGVLTIETKNMHRVKIIFDKAYVSTDLGEIDDCVGSTVDICIEHVYETRDEIFCCDAIIVR